jgi:hypothetical protein
MDPNPRCPKIRKRTEANADAQKTSTEFSALPDNHDGIVERALCLLHELLGAAPQDERAALRLRAAVEEVEPLTAHLAR